MQKVELKAKVGLAEWRSCVVRTVDISRTIVLKGMPKQFHIYHFQEEMLRKTKVILYKI